MAAFNFTTGDHIDKTENYFWRELLPDGSLGQLRQSQFNYDNCGRMTLNRSSTILSSENGVASLNHNRHDYTYDGADNMVFDNHQQTAFGGNTFVDLIQTIDFAGRQNITNHRFENGTDLGFKSIAKNSYNQWNLLDKLEIGYDINGGYLETCNYGYLGNQWLQSMNGTLFDFNIYYDSAPQSLGNPQHNGNIAEIQWQVIGGDSYAFGYEYDLYNRLTQSKSKNITANKNDEYNTTHVYDDRGNLTSMTRSGLFPNGNALISGPIDDLTFTPKSNSNKIDKVTETSLQSYGAKGSTDSFEYDSNGNLTRDPAKEATIDYNHLNLPRKVTFDHGGTIEWTYDADGTILRKQVKQESNTFEDRYYIGSGEYKDGTLVQFMHPYGRVARANPYNQNQFISGLLSTDNTYHGDNIISDASVVPIGATIFKADESIVLNEEFAVINNKVFEAIIEPCAPGDWEYEYQLNDHLGNTRLIFSDRDDDGDIEGDEILQQMHYYAFGMELNGDWKGGLKNDFNYKYNGKEAHADFDLGWLSYGARFYDPSIGRFTSIDPLTERYSFQSTYLYASNNPILFIDYMGLGSKYNWETERYEDEKGNEVGWNDVQTEYGIGSSMTNDIYSSTQSSATSSDPIMNALKANYIGYIANKVSSGEDKDDDGLIDAISSPRYTAVETGLGLIAFRFGSMASSPYYGMGALNTALGFRGFGGSLTYNAKTIESLKLLRYGGAAMSFVGLVGSGYNTFVTEKQSVEWFIGDAVASRIGFMGPLGLAAYGAYQGNKWLYAGKETETKRLVKLRGFR